MGIEIDAGVWFPRIVKALWWMCKMVWIIIWWCLKVIYKIISGICKCVTFSSTWGGSNS